MGGAHALHCELLLVSQQRWCVLVSVSPAVSESTCFVLQVFVALVAASGGLLFGYDLGVHSCSRPINSSRTASTARAHKKHLAEACRACPQLLVRRFHSVKFSQAFPWQQHSACRAVQA